MELENYKKVLSSLQYYNIKKKFYKLLITINKLIKYIYI